MFKKPKFKFQKNIDKKTNPFDWKIELNKNVTTVFSYNDLLNHISLLETHLKSKNAELKEALKEIDETKEQIKSYNQQKSFIEKDLKIEKLADKFNKENAKK
jgi:predicted  nucleic acid-binding Zn-ribbon protein